MAVWKKKARKVLDFTIDTWQRQVIAPAVITRTSGDKFKGSLGDTVDLKVGGLRAKARDYEWRTRNAPIVFDDIFGGGSFPIKLNKHVTSATKLTDEHDTMDEIEFSREVTGPMAEAIARDYETKVLSALGSVNAKVSWNGTPVADDVDPHLVTLELKRLMDQAKRVPAAGRVFLIGSDIAAQWVASDRLSRYDSIGGSAESAVRDAVIGRMAGSPVIVHPELDPTQGYYLHKSSLVVASVAPVKPRGAAFSETRTNSAGQGLTLVADYDINFATDRLLLHTYLGINEFRDETTAAGEWIFETGELDEDDLAQMYPPGERPTLAAPGTRKNVRIIPFRYASGGSVLPADALTTP